MLGGTLSTSPATLRAHTVDKNTSWASEASPTLGCSIEISRDIYISESAVALSM